MCIRCIWTSYSLDVLYRYADNNTILTVCNTGKKYLEGIGILGRSLSSDFYVSTFLPNTKARNEWQPLDEDEQPELLQVSLEMFWELFYFD